jgi:hypothetical protein
MCTWDPDEYIPTKLRPDAPDMPYFVGASLSQKHLCSPDKAAATTPPVSKPKSKLNIPWSLRIPASHTSKREIGRRDLSRRHTTCYRTTSLGEKDRKTWS